MLDANAEGLPDEQWMGVLKGRSESHACVEVELFQEGMRHRRCIERKGSKGSSPAFVCNRDDHVGPSGHLLPLRVRLGYGYIVDPGWKIVVVHPR